MLSATKDSIQKIVRASFINNEPFDQCVKTVLALVVPLEVVLSDLREITYLQYRAICENVLTATFDEMVQCNNSWLPVSTDEAKMVFLLDEFISYDEFLVHLDALFLFKFDTE